MQRIRQILTSFLSVYLFVLMVLPCTDAHARVNNDQATQITQADDNDHHHTDIEICTPFCVCGSCVAAVVLQQLAEFTFFIPKPKNRLISNFYQSLNHEFYGSIWQPPQLV